MQQKITDFIAIQLSPNTKKAYGSVLARFAEKCGQVPEGSDWINDYVSFLKGLNLGNKTINFNLGVISKFIRYAYAREIKFKNLKQKPAQITFFSEEEVIKLLNSAKPNFKGVLMFMLDTGVRVGELAALGQKKISEIKTEWVIIGKGQKQRLVVISENTKKYLEKISKDGYLFGEPWTVRKVQYHLKRLAGRNGITSKAHPHILRHTFATQILCKGAEVTEVQKMLGHAFLNTTQGYVHVTEERLRHVWKKYLEPVAVK